jgi:uncharacterized protein
MTKKRQSKQIASITPQYYHKSKYELYVAQSIIPNAGMGVFTKETIQKDNIIDEYFGDVYEINFSPSKYYFEIDKGIGIDAFNFPRCYMAMINDVYGTMYKINCEFVSDKITLRVFIKAISTIQPNEELYISYGDYYWV